MEKRINVVVEAEGRTEDVLAGRASPHGPGCGVFMFSERLPRDVWCQLKAAGAWYMSATELEEMDEFDSLPGWRYSFAAIEQLFEAGYQLNVRGEQVATVAAFRAMFTPEARAAYHQREAAEREARLAEQKRQAEAARAAREAKGQKYAAWQAARLDGLRLTYASPCERLAWRGIAFFDRDTPGTWYTTGDRWEDAITAEGHLIYRVLYGNTVRYYAPQAVVDRWCEGEWRRRAASEGEADAARHVLERALDSGVRCIGDDVCVRLVELRGQGYFDGLATSEPWYVPAEEVADAVSHPERVRGQLALAHRIGAAVVPMTKVALTHGLRYEQRLLAPGTDDSAYEICRDPEGRLFGHTYHNRWFALADEQIRVARELFSGLE